MVHGSYNGQSCGPCSVSGEGPGTGPSLYVGAFTSLAQLSTLHPAPAPGSYAFITAEDAPDDMAYWDHGDNQWRIFGSNNRVRLFGAGITNAPYPSNSVINFPESLTVLPDEIVVLSLIRVLPPPEGSFNSVHTKERYLWGKGKGLFAPIGNVTIGVDIVYIGNEIISPEDISNIPNTVTREIGTVPGGQTLEQYINGLGPGNLIDLTDETKTYFLAFEMAGVTRLAAFAGQDSANGFGFYGSSVFGGLQATAGDFSILGSSLIPTLEDVNAQGGGTTLPLIVNGPSGQLAFYSDRFIYTDSLGNNTEYIFTPDSPDILKRVARLSDLTSKLNKGANVEFEKLSDLSEKMSPFLFTRQGAAYRSEFIEWDELLKKLTIKGTQAIWEAYQDVTDGNMGIKVLEGANVSFRLFDSLGDFFSTGKEGVKRLFRIFSAMRLVSGSSYNETEFRAVECLGSVTTLIKSISIPSNAVLTVDVYNIAAMNTDKNRIHGHAQFSFLNNAGTVTNISRDELRYNRQFSSLTGAYVISSDTRIDASISGTTASINFVNTVNKTTNVQCQVKYTITQMPEA